MLLLKTEFEPDGSCRESDRSYQYQKLIQFFETTENSITINGLLPVWGIEAGERVIFFREYDG